MAPGSGAVLAVRGAGEVVGPGVIAALSSAELDRGLAFLAELRVSVSTGHGLLVGAFGRRPAEAVPETMAFRGAFRSALRRGSGGPAVQLGSGTVHVMLSLANPGALVPCDEKRVVNRYVRPLLRALTAVSSIQAHFFGRDWVSLAHHPVAWVGFGHDAGTRRTLFEAFVAVRVPFALTTRASFLGRTPATIEEVVGRPIDEALLARSIVAAYGQKVEVVDERLWPEVTELRLPHVDDDPPWEASREEAIGLVGAGKDARGIFRVGGDLLASRDAIARLEARVGSAPEPSPDDIGRIVDETLGAPGVAVDGVRSLASIRDVIAEAL